MSTAIPNTSDIALNFSFNFFWNISLSGVAPNGSPMYRYLPNGQEKVVKYDVKNSISLEQNQFFQRTQAFTSPTDMASSGVWENVILSVV